MNNGELILLYEVVERIVRFDIHLDEIKNQFYSGNQNRTALIRDFNQELKDLFNAALSQNNGSNENEIIANCKEIINLIRELHSHYLSIFPRPSEPVELTRFERVIKKQIVQLKGEQELKVSIATNESLGENANIDPLYDYKQFYKKKSGLRFSHDNSSDVDPELITVTIPRIDASNTFRWPSLIHEMCHPLLRNIQFQNNGNLKSDFLSYVSGKADENTIFNSFFATEKQEGNSSPDLEKWLEECFCDLFACLLIGPSFYFSQFVVFVNNSDETVIETHPPHQLRLGLIESLISRRFKDLYEQLLCEPIAECSNLLELMQKDNQFSFNNSRDLNDVFTIFNQYFLFLFFEEGGVKNNPSIGKELQDIIKRYVTIQSDVLESLTGRLKQGLPIPSVRTRDVNGNYLEIPTYVQEILLASWLTKLSLGKTNDDGMGLIARFKQSLDEANDNDNNNNNKTDLYEELKKIIVRHDQAVLKSIQVSEWFDFFTKERPREDRINLYIGESSQDDKDDVWKTRGVLVDKEISSLIQEDEIKIIPFMYCGQTIKGKEQNQIGTTSVDIRLGTSFQLFSSNQYGIVDFTNLQDVKTYSNSSKRVDLDFMESIVIAPGEFMLGHSMEYIKLPDTVCGNLEGRSSFARLGIEIHMTAGFIDPGFEGVITFEIYNSGPSAVRLYPGMRIGQLRFEVNEHPLRPYSKHDVKYKGLLEHNLSLQSKDVEVALIGDYFKKEQKGKV